MRCNTAKLAEVVSDYKSAARHVKQLAKKAAAKPKAKGKAKAKAEA